MKSLAEMLEDSRAHQTAFAADQHFVDHDRAWELAKEKTGVTDVRTLSREQMSDLAFLAESIRRGEANV